jgi:hypothetical protein
MVKASEMPDFYQRDFDSRDWGRVEKEGSMLNRGFRWRADPSPSALQDLDWNESPFFEFQNRRTGIR